MEYFKTRPGLWVLKVMLINLKLVSFLIVSRESMRLRSLSSAPSRGAIEGRNIYPFDVLNDTECYTVIKLICMCIANSKSSFLNQSEMKWL